MYKTHLIKPPKQQDDSIRYPDGNTGDIIDTVLFADKKAAWYTSQFAPTLKTPTLIDTCRNVWQFVKSQIPYVLDKTGEQLIKSPGRLWHLAQRGSGGDCKSFSVFTASCLRNLGIPYGYRFASYRVDDATPTHVYVYVPLKNGEIILDSVWDGPFNTQKEFKHKKDYLMSRVEYLGSVNGMAAAQHIPGELKLDKPIDQYSEGEMDLLLARQRLEIEKANSAAVGGPFNFQQDNYDEAIGVINECLAQLNNPDAICGIGEAIVAKAKSKGGKTGAGKFLQKLGKGIKKGVKAVTKVATAPLRLVAKGAMEIYLPKAAPMFLYLFAPEQGMPDVMLRKRKKADKFKKFVVNKLGMKEKHFMAIIRNKLTKMLHMSPESFLAEKLKRKVEGISGPDGKKKNRNANKGKQAKQVKQNGKVYTHSEPKKMLTALAPHTSTDVDAKDLSIHNPVKPKKSLPTFSGNLIMDAINAIVWLINKLGGKKGEVDSFSKDDAPDVDQDSSNVFEYKDMQENFDNLSNKQKDDVKEVATELMETKANDSTIERVLNTVLPYLQPKQKDEVKYEIKEGKEALDSDEAYEYAQKVRKSVQDTSAENGDDFTNFESKGGGASAGACSC